MRYGRLILDMTQENNIDIIQKIKDNESLGEDYPMIIRSISVKVIDFGEDYSIEESGYTTPTAELIIDNTDTAYTSRFLIDHDTPLECRDCELKEADISSTMSKVLIDYGF